MLFTTKEFRQELTIERRFGKDFGRASQIIQISEYERIRQRRRLIKTAALTAKEHSSPAPMQPRRPPPSPIAMSTTQDTRIQPTTSLADWQRRRLQTTYNPTPDSSISIIDDHRSDATFGPGLGFARYTAVIQSVLIEAQSGLHPGIQLFATEDSDEKMDTSSPWFPARDAKQPSSDTVSQDNRSTHHHNSSLSPPSPTYQDNSRSQFELAPHEHPGLHSGNGHYEQWYKNGSSNGHSAGYKFSTRVDTKSHGQDTNSGGSDDHFSKDDSEDADSEDADNEDKDSTAADNSGSREEANIIGDY